MGPQKDSLSLGGRELEFGKALYTHRKAQMEEHAGKKPWPAQIWGSRTWWDLKCVKKKKKKKQLLTYCTEQLANSWELQILRWQQSPRTSWQALSIQVEDRTSTETTMEKTTHGLRYTKHRWVAHMERHYCFCYRVMCWVKLLTLESPMPYLQCPHNIYYSHIFQKQHIRQSCHSCSPCCQPCRPLVHL